MVMIRLPSLHNLVKLGGLWVPRLGLLILCTSNAATRVSCRMDVRGRPRLHAGAPVDDRAAMVLGALFVFPNSSCQSARILICNCM